MKLTTALAEIVSEFSGLNHTPDFQAVRSMSNCQCSRPCSRECSRSGSRNCSRPTSGSATPVKKHSSEHKYSTIITIGAEEIPTVSITPSNETTTSELQNNVHYNSSPNVSSVFCSSSLKEKLNNIQRSNSSSSGKVLKEEHGSEQAEESNSNFERSTSVSSYRVI